MFTDTHCHLADPALLPQLPDVLAAARAANVCRFIVPATCRADWAAVLALAAPDIHSAIGIHPWFAAEAEADDLAALSQLLAQHPQALVGEIGLDFLHQNPSNEARARQISLFEQQLRLAEQHRRPVIIHNLKASAAIVGAVHATRFSQGGIVHAFSGSFEEAQAFIRCGFKIGIGSLLLNPAPKKPAKPRLLCRSSISCSKPTARLCSNTKPTPLPMCAPSPKPWPACAASAWRRFRCRLKSM